MTSLLDDKRPINAEFVDIDGTAEDITDAERDADDQLNSIFMEFGGDPNDTSFKIKVMRIIPGRGEFEHCFYCVPSELPIIERIQTEYGPGSYEIRIYKDGKILKRPKLNIAEAKTLPVIVPETKGDNTAVILNAMLESNKAQMLQFEKMMTLSAQNNQMPVVAAAPAINPMELMQSVMAMVATMNGMATKPAGEMDQFVKMAGIMKEFMPESGGGDYGEKNGVDMLLGLAKEFGGPLMELTNKVIDQPAALVPVSGQIPGQVSTTQPVPPNTSATGPKTPPIDATQSSAEQEQQIMFLKMQLSVLCSNAAKGNDQTAYAQMILDQLTDEQINQFLARPDWFEYLVSVNPNVASFKEWFIVLRGLVMEAITPFDDGAGEIPPGNETEPDTLTDPGGVSDNEKGTQIEKGTDDAIREDDADTGQDP